MGKSNVPAKKAAPQLPAEQAELLAKYSGAGMETVTKEDLQIPLIGLLQQMSPQVNPRDDQHVTDAKAGDIFHTVMKALWAGEDGTRIIPVRYQVAYNEWVPRTAGGGFVASYETKKEAEEYRDPENDLVDTAQWFVLIEMPDGIWTPAMLPMTSTKWTVSKNWLTRANMRMVTNPETNERVREPLFSRVYRISSVEQENKKGVFFNFKIDDVGYVMDVESSLFAMAVAFLEQLTSGEATVQYDAAAEAEKESEAGTPAF